MRHGFSPSHLAEELHVYKSTSPSQSYLFIDTQPAACGFALRQYKPETKNQPLPYHDTMRVVSLLPSATETLAVIGGEHLLVGRSHECDYPPSITDRPVLTAQKTHAATSAEIDQQVREALQSNDSDDTGDRSLYELDADLLRELKPDVILTQDLCDVCSIDLNTVQRIAATLDSHPTIVNLNPKTIEDVFEDVLKVGSSVDLTDAAEATVVQLREQYWTAIDYVNPYVEGPEVVLLEWMDPLFIAGHWTPQLIRAAGGRFSLNEPGEKSKQIQPEDLLEVSPQRVIICPCGYDIEQTTRELDTLRNTKWWNLLPAVQNNDVVIVDGKQMFNRPGPRLVEAFRWLTGWLNDRPELIPPEFPVVEMSAVRSG